MRTHRSQAAASPWRYVGNQPLLLTIVACIQPAIFTKQQAFEDQGRSSNTLTNYNKFPGMRRFENRFFDLGVVLHAALINLTEPGQGWPICADDGVVVLGEGLGEPFRVVEVDGVRCVVALGCPFLWWVAGDAHDRMAPGEELIYHARAALPLWSDDSYFKLLLWVRHG